MQTLRSPMQMRLSGVIKRAVEGPGISWKQGVLHRQTSVTGLPESVTLLKSTFKPQESSVFYQDSLSFPLNVNDSKNVIYSQVVCPLKVVFFSS